MLKEHTREIGISFISILACLTYFYVAKIMDLPYFRASFIKIILFCVIPTLFLYMVKEKNVVKNMFKVNKISELKFGFFTTILVAIVGAASIGLVSNVAVFEEIAREASRTITMTFPMYIVTAVYIVLINALVEEYFFRGIVYFQLRKNGNRKFANVFSALLFSLYHFAIFETGMSFVMYMLGYLGLFITGLIFNYIDEKPKNIYNSWIVHAVANSAINMLGLYILLKFK